MKSKFRSSYFIENYKYFIFDFDGIIKESVDEKRSLFVNYSQNINLLSL